MQNVEKPQKVDEQAVLDLLRSTDRNPERMQAVLEDLLELTPWLDAHAEDIEQMPIGSRPDRGECCSLPKEEIISCMTELCNHVDKRAVIEAALAAVMEIRSLEGREAQVAEVFKRLDPRTRAILALRDSLSRADGVLGTGYCNALINAVDNVDCEEVLKDDPVVVSCRSTEWPVKQINCEGCLWKRRSSTSRNKRWLAKIKPQKR